MKISIAIALFILVAVLPSAAGARGGYWIDCGTEAPSIFITTKAHGTSCFEARRVGRRYALEGDRHPLGFDCSQPRSTSSESSKGTCRRDQARVKVSFGV